MDSPRGLFAVVGLLGTVLPVLPGAPLAYATLWMMWLAELQTWNSVFL